MILIEARHSDAFCRESSEPPVGGRDILAVFRCQVADCDITLSGVASWPVTMTSACCNVRA